MSAREERPAAIGDRKALGWKQRMVLREFEETFEGRVVENIQRVCAAAIHSPRRYLSPSDTQRIIGPLVRRGLLERVGPNGYRAVPRG